MCGRNYDEAERLYRKALELAPTNASATHNYAIFMKNVRKNVDEAERLYRKSLGLDPDNATAICNFADFMTHVRENDDEADRLYRRALELNAKSANIAGNFAGFLLYRGDLDNASRFIEMAIELNHGEPRQLLGEVLLYKATLQALRDTSYEQTLHEMRELLHKGFSRGAWTFQPVLASVGKKLSAEALAILRACGEAVLDDNRAAVLDDTLSALRKQFAVIRKPARIRKLAKRPARRKTRVEKLTASAKKK